MVKFDLLFDVADKLFPVYSGRRQILKKILDRLNLTPRRSSVNVLKKPTFSAEDQYKAVYLEKIETSRNDLPNTFVPITGECIDHSRLQIKTIAFYLPQFHPIPENDRAWGQGFTEWTNVTKAVPHFSGHYQPRLPGDLGFYDLRIKENQKKQIEIAKKYGIHGFCYHHYWFDGKRLLEMPFKNMLADKSLDFPFCLCWANENWSKRWDGGDDDIIMAQNHSPEDDIKFIMDIEAALKDPRYIRIDGKALLIVYRPLLLPDPKATAERWREYARKAGIGELAIYSAATFGFTDYKKINFDGLIQFPPHNIRANEMSGSLKFLHPDFSGAVYDYESYVQKALDSIRDDVNTIPCTMMAWDNTARKGAAGNVFHGCTPLKYKEQLSNLYDYVMAREEREKIVFINAWNEWAEGTYLEPDRRYGYAYLHATADAMRRFYTKNSQALEDMAQCQSKHRKSGDAAIILNLYYEDLWKDFFEYYKEMPQTDLFISLPEHVSHQTVSRIIADVPNVYPVIVKNRGRDILPFLNLFKIVRDKGYRYFGKVHSKKTTYRKDGSKIRERLFDSLLGKRNVDHILTTFETHPDTGIICPQGTVLSLSKPEYVVNNISHLEGLLDRMGCHGQSIDFPFICGSMFWARTEAMDPFMALNLSESDFEEELGQNDGTLAHAVERLFLFSGEKMGYRHQEI